MGGVLDGQAVSAAVTNPAFLDANGDDTGVGKITLANPDPVSGSQVDNLQREHNSAASYMGKTLNSAAADLPAWTTSVVGTGSDSLFDRADALTERFDGTTGHTHDGTAGEGPQILAVNIDAVPLQGFIQQGTDQLGVTGSSVDVSLGFAGKTPGGGSTTEGVVTTGAFNKVVIRQASGSNENDAFVDALGNVVYGRLTEAAGVWTLSFFVLVSGTETIYTFLVSSDVRYYYQEIFNPLGGSAPVFSEFAVIPSDNVTAEVITATTTQQGKVSLSASAPGNISATGSAGTASASVANANHTHEGLHSISKSGSAQILGDATLSSAGGVTLTQTLNDIQISAPALTAVAPQDIGSSNQVGTGTASAREDHVHEGVHTVKLSGNPDIYGDVTLAVSNGTSATQVGSTITLSSPALTVTAAQDVGSTGSAGVATDAARSDHVHRGVTSVSKNGSAQLYGNVTLSAGSNVTLTQAGQDISIAATAGSLSNNTPQNVGSTASAGVGTSASRDDHVHEGLHSIAKSGSSQILGDATLTGSGAVTLTQSVNNIQISAPATDTVTTPNNVGSAGSAGVSTSPAPADHTHRGVASFAKNGSAALYGAVTISGGTNITLTQTGQDVSIANNPVAGAYSTSAAQTVNNNTATTIVYPTVNFETTTMINTGTGILTVPEAGYYRLSVGHYFGTATANTATDIQVYVEKSTGGGGYVQLQGTNLPKSGTAATPFVVQGSFLVSCIAGDLLRIRILHVNSASANFSLLANAQFNYMTINKVG